MPEPIWEPSPARGCMCALAAGALFIVGCIAAAVWL